MKIGCPTEIKPQEFRVGLTPAAAAEETSVEVADEAAADAAKADE